MAEESNVSSTVVGPSLVPRLEIVQGEPLGKTFRLKFKARLGREADNDVVITDPRASRYHCQIAYENGEWVLSDLGSANGTLFNDRRLGAPQTIEHGDQIQLGETILRFLDPAAEGTSGNTISTPAVQRPQAAGHPVTEASTGRMARIAAGLIIILILAVASLILWLRNNNQNQNENETVSATATFPPTLAISGNPDQGPQIPDLHLQYEDDFSDSNSGWDDASGPFYTKRYGNNQYNIDISTNNLVVWGMANRNAADFEVEVEATKRQGGDSNTYGLIFRFLDNDNYYRFDVSSDGYFHLAKLENGQWDVLVDWTGTSAINAGGEANLLKVSAFGPEIAVAINEQALASVMDPSFSNGNFGFFASTFDDPNIWVSFDNFRLLGTSDQEIVIIPTATRTPASVAIAPQSQDTQRASDSLAATPTPTTAIAETSTSDATTATPSPEVVVSPTPTVTSIEAEPSPSLETTEVITDNGDIDSDQTGSEVVEAEPAPTIVSEELPDFVSRDQFRGRNEQVLSGKITFPVYDSSRGTYDIYQANLDGSDRTLIAEEASQPDLNANGNLIAYRSWKGDERGLITRPLDQTQGWRFVSFFEAAQPIFSPDEQFFVFHSREGGETPAIYRTFGTEHQVLRRDGYPMQGSMPAFTPDGRIVYRGCLNNSCGLTLSNLDGSGPLQLTDYANDTAPAVSPDSQTIAFMSDRDGDWEIYIMDTTGQNLTQLTNNTSNDGLPVWSPDGRTIAFVSSRDGEWAIWLMSPTGALQRKSFALNGSIDGIVQLDITSSFGWLEENLDWTP